jgi:hypothetical protein
MIDLHRKKLIKQSPSLLGLYLIDFLFSWEFGFQDYRKVILGTGRDLTRGEKALYYMQRGSDISFVLGLGLTILWVFRKSML